MERPEDNGDEKQGEDPSDKANWLWGIAGFVLGILLSEAIKGQEDIERRQRALGLRPPEDPEEDEKQGGGRGI